MPPRAGLAAANIAHAAPAIQTVLGPLDASKLGFTLTHEHICKHPPHYGSRANALAKAVDKLKEARDTGVDTIIDVTPFGVGRDVRFGQEASRKSGMQIVACTGQHQYAPESFSARSVQEITELFVKEIEQGIGDTGIRAGVIKVAAHGDSLDASRSECIQNGGARQQTRWYSHRNAHQFT